jgi:hypothetical protein
MAIVYIMTKQFCTRMNLQIFLVHFLSRVEGLRSPKSYIGHHYTNRYGALYPLDGLYMRKLLKSFSCYSDDKSLYESVLSR